MEEKPSIPRKEGKLEKKMGTAGIIGRALDLMFVPSSSIRLRKLPGIDMSLGDALFLEGVRLLAYGGVGFGMYQIVSGNIYT